MKVVLQSPEGKYLSGSAVNWRFTEDRASAIVFDLFAQPGNEQLAVLSQRFGVRLQPVPLPPEEVNETCDSCHRLLMPRQIFFDGRRFLCFDCKAGADAQRQAERSMA